MGLEVRACPWAAGILISLTLGCDVAYDPVKAPKPPPRKAAMEFPNDANGDVLRKMHESGMDFSKSYDIEFFHLFKDEKGARAMARDVSARGDRAEVDSNEEQSAWDCMVVMNMKPSHKEITAAEESLGRIAAEHGGKSDGWGVLQE